MQQYLQERSEFRTFFAWNVVAEPPNHGRTTTDQHGQTTIPEVSLGGTGAMFKIRVVVPYGVTVLHFEKHARDGRANHRPQRRDNGI